MAAQDIRLRRAIFAALFAAVVVFALLYAARILHATVVSDYATFVLLGLLASVLMWGILSSTGEISGSAYGVQIKLGGAVVPLVVIVGGGLWLQSKDRTSHIKVRWVTVNGNPARVTGDVRLEVAGVGNTPVALLTGSDIVTIDGIEPAMAGQPASFTLNSPTYQIHDAGAKNVVQPDELFTIVVDPVVATVVKGTVLCGGEDLCVGASVYVEGVNCPGGVASSNGFFEIPCPEATFPATLVVHLPATMKDDFCPKTFRIDEPTGHTLRLSLCAVPEGGTTVDGVSIKHIHPTPPPCGGGNANAALQQVLDGLHVDQKVSVTATLDPKGFFTDVHVSGGDDATNGRVASKVAAQRADKPRDCTPADANASATPL
jgi:hypothetical protein